MAIYVILDLTYNMNSQIVIFEGNKKDGIFSSAKKFYKEGITNQEIFEEIKKSRIRLGKKCGFSGLKMFQVTQKMEDNNSYPDNKYVMLDDNYMMREDFFKEEIKADILLISNKYKRIALAHRMADCPVLILEDRKQGITAIVHCGFYHINRGLPKEFINIMITKFNSKPNNLYLYIGSHIHKENYIYDKYPEKATNKDIWEDAIEEKDGKYYIDLEKAIRNQIKNFDLAEIKVSTIDTATNKDYASHREFTLGNKEKAGQNIVGFYYK